MIAATVTPGATILGTTPTTPSDLNALGTPTIAFSGTLSAGEIAAGAVTAAKVTPGAFWYGTTSNSGNDYTLTLSPVLTALTDGAEIAFKVNASNTGAATLDVNSLGAKAIRKLNDAAMAAGDLRANAIYTARYNTAWNSPNGAWEIISPTGGGSVGVLYGPTDSGGSNTPTIDVSPRPVALADIAGVPVTFKAAATNSGASTLTLTLAGGSSPATAILKNGEQALTVGDITANAVVTVIYNGTYFILQSPPAPALYYGADAGANDDYVVTPVPAYAGSAYYTGMVVCFKANTANTGAATLAVSVIASQAIKKSVTAALNTGDIRAGQWVTVVFDGTNWQMQGPSVVVATTALGSVPAYSTTTSLAHNLSGVPQLVRVVMVLDNGAPDAGYAANDEVDLMSAGNINGAITTSVRVDSSNVVVARYSAAAGVIYLVPKTGGVGTAITESKWRLKAYCQLSS